MFVSALFHSSYPITLWYWQFFGRLHWLHNVTTVFSCMSIAREQFLKRINGAMSRKASWKNWPSFSSCLFIIHVHFSQLWPSLYIFHFFLQFWCPSALQNCCFVISFKLAVTRKWLKISWQHPSKIGCTLSNLISAFVLQLTIFLSLFNNMTCFTSCVIK